MSYNVEIKIFGKVSNPEAIWNLAQAASNESSLFADDGFDVDDFANMLEKAAAAGDAIEFYKNGYDDVFESVTSACQEAGLSYVWSIGEHSGDGPTNGVAWRPGLNDEIPFLVHDGKYGLSLDVIAKAARKGIDEVNSLVKTVASLTAVGKIEIEPGFMALYQALANDGDTEEDEEDNSLTL